MASANKAKIAKRVIEVFEFFDEFHREATVMAIARRYDWPQSSTSELLSSLVDLGLLYKNNQSRSYTLTPRAAMLGASIQPEFVRDGRLVPLMDRLAAQTGSGVALLGMVGLDAQVFAYSNGRIDSSCAGRHLCNGSKERLTNSASGWMLLSTIPERRREAIIRRLNADAPDDEKFNFAEMCNHIQNAHDVGSATGAAGFGLTNNMCAVLLPGQSHDQSMVLSLVYDLAAQSDLNQLTEMLVDAAQSLSGESAAFSTPAFPGVENADLNVIVHANNLPADHTRPVTRRATVNGTATAEAL